MLFGNKKVSSKDVLSYYTSVAVLEHYSQATEKVGLWNSERIVLKKAFTNKSLKLLELGCGVGRIAFGLSTLGYTNLTATDFSPKMVKRAQNMERRNKKSIKFELQDAISLSYEDQSFDGVIFGFNGLMQIPGSDNRNAVIRESLRVLKPAGKFVFTSHDRNLPKWKKFWKIERQKWQKANKIPCFKSLVIDSRKQTRANYIFMCLKLRNCAFSCEKLDLSLKVIF